MKLGGWSSATLGTLSALPHTVQYNRQVCIVCEQSTQLPASKVYYTCTFLCCTKRKSNLTATLKRLLFLTDNFLHCASDNNSDNASDKSQL